MAMIFLINTICIKIDSICCSTLIVGNLVVWWVRKIDYIGWKSCDIKVLNPLLLCFFCTLFQQILSLLSTLSVYLAQQIVYRNQQISLRKGTGGRSAVSLWPGNKDTGLHVQFLQCFFLLFPILSVVEGAILFTQ